MAKKRKSTKEEAKKSNNQSQNNELWTRGIIGIALLIVAIYLSAAFACHLFTWRGDQSLEWENIYRPLSVSADNPMGTMGATAANVLMSKGFGIGAFAIPLLLLFATLRILQVRMSHPYQRLMRILVGMILLSLDMALLFGSTGGYLGAGLGGAYGYYMVQWGSGFIGFIGLCILLIPLTVIYLMWMNHRFSEMVYRQMRLLPVRFRAWRATRKQNETAGDPTENPTPTTNQKPQQQPTATTPSNNQGNESGQVEGEDERPTVPPRPQPATTPPKKDNGVGFVITPPQGEEQPTAPKAPQGATGQSVAPETPPHTGFEVEHNEPEMGQSQQLDVTEDYDPTLELPSYQLPPLELLEDHELNQPKVTEAELVEKKDTIVATLRNYKIDIDHIKATVGPTVTLYEVVPAPGVRISQIKKLEDDIALSLSALGIRIIAPIPGKGTVGIEVPNANPSVVSMQALLRSKRFQESKAALPIALGRTISNEVYVVDLAKMPHLLVAGATGQGKSVGLNAIIASLLYRKHPAQLKFVLVDPKKVELTLYARLERHFLAKLPNEDEAIITDTQKVINTLTSLCTEMDARYDLLKMAEVRHISEYNERFIHRRLNPEKGHRFLPYIVVVIDEFADLIMTAGKEVELPIARLAQLARAIGIHLIIATQRPTTNIITGLIKANFPARVAFRVTSQIDSRTILDNSGANQLIGRGDMLVSTGGDMVRLQCPFLDTPEVERITDFIANQRGYATAFMLPECEGDSAGASTADLSERDELFDDVARFMVAEGKGICSTSMIQRKYGVGYNRAGKIVDQLEAAGIVGPQVASKPREMVVNDLLSLEQLLQQLPPR